MKNNQPVIAVVGPCAAGKTTLISGLRDRGYLVRHIAQEHSYVPQMWELLVNPDYLIYLDVTYQVSKERTDSTWQETIFNKQVNRLRHARDHADLIINTNQISPEQVLTSAIEFLTGDEHG